ncbi:MAG: type I DNA topoisomerase [Anaerolineales bacterium]|nr:type I DNA topoisomerase [Anaerolineales bacterium]
MKETLTAYCVKCREKRPIQNQEASFNKRGSPVTRGICPECGTGLYRMGRTEAHESIEKPKPQPKPRKGNLVIVESPTKAKTIGRFLGKNFKVMASVGHVRDLLRSKLSVDVENNFEPSYRVPNEKRKVVKELTAAVENAATIYLATDVDREGEAIAWHLMESTGMDPKRTKRVVFHEITDSAIAKAFADPIQLNMDMVDAQQARRILDRLVGYKISPLLWARVRNRLTAGRVQSVAVRLVVEREREIDAFIPEEYWSLEVDLEKIQFKTKEEANLTKAARSFRAKLHRIRGNQFELPNKESVAPILDDLESGIFQVNKVRIGQRKRRPQPPFTTSTMQQTASGRLRFQARRTMQVAQQLYEGIELGEGESVGLITYMRTDSVQVSEEAQNQAREWITHTFGKEYIPVQPPRHKGKAKITQEAHEAIRPTAVHRTPTNVKPFLSRDQFRLYELIWQRFVASQMSAAIFDTQSIDILAGPSVNNKPYLFRATGQRLAFAGYLKVNQDSDDENNKELPPLTKDELLKLIQLVPEQHFTQPPPRYTEATLIATMEEHGIGRPSTYAPTLSTIQKRGYVESADRSSRALKPTEIGILVNDLLVEHFPDIISVGFTADMESRLDLIANGQTGWRSVLGDFYRPFAARLAAAEKNMPDLNLGDQEINRDCPQCNGRLVIKYGRFGKFIACDKYPQCKYTEPWLDKIGVLCPVCQGDLVRKRTRKGRIFYGCAGYPNCEFTSWKLPLPYPCPACKGLLVVQKKDTAQCIDCENQFSIDVLREKVEKLGR